MPRSIGNPLLLLILLTTGLLTPAQVQAHAQWLQTRNPAVAVEDSVVIELGSGHEFPHSEMAEEPEDASVIVLDATGNSQVLDMRIEGNALRGSFVPLSPGCHRVYFGVERGEISRTADGWQDGTRATWPEADMCLDYFIGAMAFVMVGEAEWSAEPLGLPLELQVVRGGPAGLTLQAYRRGHPEPDLGLRIWRKGEGFVALGQTDADGKLEITDLPKAASHLISATYRKERPEGSDCDEDLYRFNIVVEQTQLR